MPRFLGHRSVLRDLRKHLFKAGKTTAATLKVRATGDNLSSVSYAHCYLWPQDERTGLGGGAGYPTINGKATLWRTGETSAPRVDDQLVVSGTTYLIVSVQPRLNGDEGNNIAVYDCDLTR